MPSADDRSPLRLLECRRGARSAHCLQPPPACSVLYFSLQNSSSGRTELTPSDLEDVVWKGLERLLKHGDILTPSARVEVLSAPSWHPHLHAVLYNRVSTGAAALVAAIGHRNVSAARDIQFSCVLSELDRSDWDVAVGVHLEAQGVRFQQANVAWMSCGVFFLLTSNCFQS